MYFAANQNDEVRKLRKLLDCYIKKCGCDVFGQNSSTTSTGFEDAPSDSKLYGRKNKSWTPIEISNLIHNELGGKQGGDGTDFFHLSKAQIEALEELFNLVDSPIYEEPTADLDLEDQILEVGTALNITLKNTYTINDGGALQSEKIFRNGLEVSNTGIYTETGDVVEGETIYVSSSTHLAGPVKENAIGIEDGTNSIAAGTIVSEAKTITGIVPWFWKVYDTLPDLNNLNLSTFNKEVEKSDETVKILLNTDLKHVVIVIPDENAEKTEWFVSQVSQGEIGEFNAVGPATVKTLPSPDGLWTARPFKIYTTNYQTSIKPALELRNN